MTTPTTLPEALTEIEELRGQVRELLRLLGQEAPLNTGAAGLSTSEIAGLNGMPEISLPQVSLERKQTGRERTQIVAEGRNVIEIAPDIIFKLDLHGNLAGWNKRLETVTGFVPEELNSRPAVSFAPECEREQAAAAIRQAFEQGYAELEGHLLTKTGRMIPYHWTGATLENHLGHAIGLIGVGRDRTVLKHAEEALRTSEARFRELVETTTDWMWEINELGAYTYCSPKIREFLGYEPDEAIGKTPFDFMPPEEAHRVAALFGPIAAGRKPFAGIENINRRKDGQLVTFECRGIPIFGADGSFRGYRGFDQDVTRRKLFELQNRERLDSMIRFQEIQLHLHRQPFQDLTEGLRTILRMAANAVSIERVGIWLFSDDHSSLICRELYQLSLNKYESGAVLDASHYPRYFDALDQSLPLAVNDVLTDPRTSEFTEDYFIPLGISSVMDVAVRRDGAIIGVVWFEHTGLKTEWSEEEQAFARSIGDHVALCLLDAERQQTEMALRESEARFAAAVEGSTDVLWDAQRIPGVPWHAPETPIWWSPRMRQFLGLEDGESFDTLGQWVARLHPDDRNHVLGRLTAHIEQRVPYDTEYRLRTNHGEYRWMRGKGQAIWDEQGEPCRMSGSCQDISERKRVEAALQESESHFRAMIENSSDIITVLDLDGTIRFESPSFERLLGYAQHEIDGLIAFDFIHPDDLPAVIEKFQRIVQRPGETQTAEFHFRHQDGSWLTLESVGRATCDARSRSCVIVNSRDITERKRAEEELRKRESLITLMLNTGPGCIKRVAADGTLLHMNPAGLQLIEACDEHEAIGRCVFDLVMPEHRETFIQMHEDVIAGRPRTLQFEIQGFNGTRRWMETYAVPFQNPVDERTEHLAVTHDITERKRAEEALIRSRNLLMSFVEHTPAAVAMLDTDLRYVAVSRHWRTDYRLGDEPLVGRRHYDMFPEIQDMKEWQEIHQRCLSGSVERREEDRFVRADGSEDWLRWEVRPWHDVTGEIGGIIMFTEVITARKQAEEAKRRLIAIVESSDDAIISKDLEGRVTSWNRGAEQLFGYQAAEVVGRSVTILFPLDRLQEELLILERLRRGESIEHFETIRLTKDGRRLNIALTLSPMRDEHGTIVGISKIAHDVTERKCMEDALRMTQFSIDRASDAVLWMDSGSHILNVNDAACRMLNYTREDLLAMSMQDLDPNISTESWALHWAQLKQKGSVTFESKYWSSTGRVVETEITANYLQYGDIEYDCAIVRNVTARKQAEATLRLAKFSMERTADAVYWIDPQAMILDVNEAASAMLGYSKDEFCAMTVHDLNPDFQADRWPGFWADTKQRGTIVLETAHRAKDGRLIPIEVSINYLAYEGQEYHCAFVRDITERKRAEHEVSERTQLILKKQAALLRLTHLDDTGLTLSDLLPRVCEIVAETLGVARVSVWLLSEDGTELVCQNLYDCSHAVHSAGSRLSTSQYPRYLEEIVARLVVAVPDALADPRTSEFVDHYFLPLGITSMMDVPIRRQGTLVGVLWLEHVGLPRDWSHEAQSFGASVGEILGRMMETVERKRVEVELQNSHAFMRQVIDTDPNFIFAKDRGGRFTLVNKAIADVYGTTVDDLIGKTDVDFNSRHEEVTQFRLKDLEVMDTLQERFIPEEKITDATGKIRWLQTVKRPLLDAQGHAVMLLGASTDITARKRMEEILRQRERDLRAAVEERERIGEDLHDGILQSIFAVGLGLESCRTLISELPLPRKKVATPLMEILNRAIGQLNHVMTDVRNFIAGIESHVLEGADIGEIWRTMGQAMCASNGTACRVTIEESAIRELSTEQAYHAMNIMREALSNSIRHSGAGRITLSFKRLRRSVRLSVTDNGKGFVQDSARDVGHGLINMAARARKLGGQIEVRSRPRQGTKVLLDIPRRPVDE